MIRVEGEVCSRLEESLRLEWLETNGVGGFASGTVAGANTRRYHGLLTAATKPPVGRLVLLAKVEETLVVGGQLFELGVNEYPGAVHPRGHLRLREFRLDPWPCWVWEAGGVRLEKRVFAVRGENTTVVEYGCEGAGEVEVELRPLIAFRDYHALTHENGALDGRWESGDGWVRLAPYSGMPGLYLAHNATAVEISGHWYRDFEYARERERGLDFREDLFQPLVLRYRLREGETAVCVASTERREAGRAAEIREQERKRRARVKEQAPAREPVVEELTAAADQFLVKRGEGWTVIAGYPWFSDWGRDTMIALPGLTLATGRFEAARGILLAFAESMDQGMLPNRFPDAGEKPEYNTVDATLWFVEAVRAYVAHTGDAAFVREHLWKKLVEMVEWHLRGTRYGIRMDADGLLACGEAGVQLTWMDAKIGDWVVTPRAGKPVEIQALWHNALCVVRDLSRQFGEGERALFLGQLAARARSSFGELFWNESEGGLYDVVNGAERDASVRPNQIFAVSLHHALLEGERARRVVELVQRELWTPKGLRTLARGDARYRARYSGGVWERDSAYHQGTVWPWLMGPFVTASMKVNGSSAEARETARGWVRAFSQAMREECLGQVSEVADGDAPQAWGGCVAQAWSVAELLRCWVEDLREDCGGETS
ncbi:MAG: glycogen debranching enzyme N-terminal domain-containing protein [Acidobacteria bacterium]|nr:glycogen debranching enzyme N-terminal domain-containing protein [Acidobacteriota bacterium]